MEICNICLEFQDETMYFINQCDCADLMCYECITKLETKTCPFCRHSLNISSLNDDSCSSLYNGPRIQSGGILYWSDFEEGDIERFVSPVDPGFQPPIRLSSSDVRRARQNWNYFFRL